MSELVKVDQPAGHSRMETGPVQFGDDWPGIFIRGDNANYYGFNLGEGIKALRAGDIELAKHYLSDPIVGVGEQLSELLTSCDVRKMRKADEHDSSKQRTG